MNGNEEIAIIGRGNRKITRKYLFKKKQEFHKALAKIPFEEKIKILFRLQKIASEMKSAGERGEHMGNRRVKSLRR